MDQTQDRRPGALARAAGLYDVPAELPAGQRLDVSFSLRLPCGATPD